MHLKTYVIILIVAVFINEVSLYRNVGLGTFKRRVLNPLIRRGGRPLRRTIRRVNIGSIIREQKGLHRHYWDRFTRDPQFLVQLPRLSFLCESIQVMHGRSQQRRSKQFDMWTARQLHVPRARLPSIRLAMDLLCQKISSLPIPATTKRPKITTTTTRRTSSFRKATSRKPSIVKTTQSFFDKRCLFTHHTKPGSTKKKNPDLKQNISTKIYGSATKATTLNLTLTTNEMTERRKTSKNPRSTTFRPTSSETTQSFKNMTNETFEKWETTHNPKTTTCETIQNIETTTHKTTETTETTQQPETTTFETTRTSETTPNTESTTYGSTETTQQTETTTYETTETSETTPNTATSTHESTETTQQTEATTYETTETSETTANTETTTYETTVTDKMTQYTTAMTYKDMEASETTQSSGIPMYRTTGISKTAQKFETTKARKGESESTRNSDTPTHKPIMSPKPSQTLNDTKHIQGSKKHLEPNSVAAFTAGGTLFRSSTFEPKAFQEPEQEILEDGEFFSNPSVSKSQKNFTSKLQPTPQSTKEPQQDIFSPKKSIELDLSNEQISPESEKEDQNETSTELGGILPQSRSPATSSTVKKNWKKGNTNKKMHKLYDVNKLEVMNKYAIAHIIKSLGVKGGNLKFTKTYISKLLNAVR